MKAFARSHILGMMISFSFLSHCSTALAEELKPAHELVLQSGVKGGLIVHIGAVDVEAIAALRLNERYLVQSCQRDASRVSQARKSLQRMRLLGPVTVIQWRRENLPYADNLVNLLIVRDPPVPAPPVARQPQAQAEGLGSHFATDFGEDIRLSSVEALLRTQRAMFGCGRSQRPTAQGRQSTN